MIQRSPIVALVLAAGLGALPASPAWLVAPAFAQQDPQRAKALFAEAKDLHEAGKTREALGKLKEAYEAFPADGILVSIANRHLDLGEPEEAAEILSRIETRDPNLRKQVKRLQEDVEAKLAEPVTVRISADAALAKVSVDGQPARELPTTLQLPRGNHRFLFTAPGRDDVVVTRELRGTSEVTIEGSMPAPNGRFQVNVTPAGPLGDLRVFVGKRQVSLKETERSAPLSEPRELPAGRYEIRCLRGVDDFASTVIEVQPGEVAVATCAFTPPVVESDNQTWGWVSAGAGALALAGGIAFLAAYVDETERFPEPRYRIESTKPLASGLLFAGAVGFGAASYLFFTDFELLEPSEE